MDTMKNMKVMKDQTGRVPVDERPPAARPGWAGRRSSRRGCDPRWLRLNKLSFMAFMAFMVPFS